MCVQRKPVFNSVQQRLILLRIDLQVRNNEVFQAKDWEDYRRE